MRGTDKMTFPGAIPTPSMLKSAYQHEVPFTHFPSVLLYVDPGPSCRSGGADHTVEDNRVNTPRISRLSTTLVGASALAGSRGYESQNQNLQSEAWNYMRLFVIQCEHKDFSFVLGGFGAIGPVNNERFT